MDVMVYRLVSPSTCKYHLFHSWYLHVSGDTSRYTTPYHLTIGSVTDEDDIRCIVNPVYGDTIEVERPTTHSRKYNKIRPENIADCHAIETHVVQPSLLKKFLFPSF